MKTDFFEPGVIFHVYNRGNNKENLFKEERNYSYFLSLVEKHILPVADVLGYCLLKNHFHLVIKIKDEKLLEEKFKKKPYLAFSNLFNAYTKAINKAYNRSGSLFQEHLKRVRVEDKEYLVQLMAYVHLNPLKHKFCDDFRSYPYSSYNAFISGKSSVINCPFILHLFDNMDNFEKWHDLNKISLEHKIEASLVEKS